MLRCLEWVVENVHDKERVIIFSDSTSALSFVEHCYDRKGEFSKQFCDIFSKIVVEVIFQWVPSHIGLFGNERADVLAKQGALSCVNLGPLTTDEISSLTKKSAYKKWVVDHHWYKANKPGQSLNTGLQRSEQSAVTRFCTGHLRYVKYDDGVSTHPVCPNCSVDQASPQHLSKCLGISPITERNVIGKILSDSGCLRVV